MSVAAMLRSAWRSSRAGLAARSLSGVHERVKIRSAGVAVAIAAAMQPFLIWMMPRTVKPSMPWWVFVIVAVFAATAAWRPAPFAEAWHHSRVRRWSRLRQGYGPPSP